MDNEASRGMSPHIVGGTSTPDRIFGPSRRFFHFLKAPFASAWRHRDLIHTIVRRELDERFKGSAAGWVWAIFSPLLSLVTYSVVFGGVVKLPNDLDASSKFDYALFIFGGLIAFSFFSEMAYRAPSLLHEYAHFIRHTIFPADMLPIISTLRAAFYASIGLGTMLLAQLVLTGTLHWTVLLLPFWFVPFVGFLIGLTWFLSALGSFTRDVSYFMATIAPLLMFATPVFFSQTSLPSPWDRLIYLNVMTGYIEIVRELVVLGRLPSVWVCLWTGCVSGVSFWSGYWFFNRNRDAIADIV